MLRQGMSRCFLGVLLVVIGASLAGCPSSPAASTAPATARVRSGTQATKTAEAAALQTIEAALAEATPPARAASTEPAPSVPSGRWYVRAQDINDAALIFVNSQLVAGDVRGLSDGDTDWVDITGYLASGKESSLVFASWNEKGSGKWAFAIRREDEIKWSTQGSARSKDTMQYVQAVTIYPNGDVLETAPDVTAQTPPPGAWGVQVNEVRDVGVILINGWPVTGVSRNTTSWIDITSYLDNTRANTVTAWVWSKGRPYGYQFSLKHDDIVVWEKVTKGKGPGGPILAGSALIGPDGEVRPVGPVAGPLQVRAYGVDDAAAIVVDGRMVGGVVKDIGSSETGWVDVADVTRPPKTLQITLASWNGRGSGTWAFALRQGDTIIYRVEGKGDNRDAMQFMSTISVSPEGDMLQVPSDVASRPCVMDVWCVELGEIDDIALVLVNDQLVGGAFRGSEIKSLAIPALNSNRENRIRLIVWNIEGTFSFSLALQHHQVPVWNFSRSGSGLLGTVFDQTLTVLPDGRVSPDD